MPLLILPKLSYHNYKQRYNITYIELTCTDIITPVIIITGTIAEVSIAGKGLDKDLSK